MKAKHQLLSIPIVIVVWVGAILNCNAQVCFNPALNFSAAGVRPEPYSLTSADFNSDGNLDIAVTNEDSHDGSLLLGNGNGTFGVATTFVTGFVPISIITTDFNGDGKADLAVANSGSITILLGDGAGGFTDTTFAVGNAPVSVMSDDFDADGNADLAVVNSGSVASGLNQVFVLLGKGDGTFGTANDFAVGNYATSVTSADLDWDGKVDLAVTNGMDNNISILLGDGTGSFGTATSFAVDSFPRSVTTADFNGDGKDDLAVANYGTNNVSVLLGKGSGAVSLPDNFKVGNYPYSVISADFNADGKADLAVSNAGSGNVSVLPGDGTGSFGSAVMFAVGSVPFSVISADFNKDSKADLASANYGSDNVSILLNCFTVDIADPISNEAGMVVYPNPTDGKFTITMDASVSLRGLEIYNVLGTVVYKSLILTPIAIGAKSLIDLSSQPRGVYFLKSRNPDGSSAVIKIIKK